jgi:hypothetical protein
VRFGDPKKMPPDPLGANRTVERLHFIHQPDRQTIGNQRGEFGFKIQHLGTDALAQQLRQLAHRDRWVLGAWTNPDPFAGEPKLSEWRPEHDRMVTP